MAFLKKNCLFCFIILNIKKQRTVNYSVRLPASNLTNFLRNLFKSGHFKMGTVPNEELCLRWNDFESILSRSFTEMRQEADFFDVRIACYNDKKQMKTIPAHKVVLSACSPVFKDLLRALNEAGSLQKQLIFIRGISYHEMEAVLDFMYNGQTKIKHTELDAFLAAAEELKVKGLTNNSSSTNNVTPKKRHHSPEPSSSRSVYTFTKDFSLSIHIHA